MRVEEFRQDIRPKASALGWLEKDNIIIAGLRDAPLICQFDNESEEIQVLDYIKECSLSRSWFFGKSACNEKWLVFSPVYGNYIPIVDLTAVSNDEPAVSFFRIDEELSLEAFTEGKRRKLEINDDEWKYWEVAEKAGLFYIFGFKAISVLCFDPEKRSIRVIDSWDDKIPRKKQLSESNNPFCFGDGYCKFDDVVYLASGMAPGIFGMDCETGTIDFVEIKGGYGAYLGISRYGDDKILLTDGRQEQRSIIIYDPYTGDVEKINIPEISNWYHPIVFGDEAYLFSFFGGVPVYRIDLKTHECEVCSEIDEVISFTVTDDYGNDSEMLSGIDGVQLKYDTITFTVRESGKWYRYHIPSRSLEEKNYVFKDEYLLKEYRKAYFDDRYKEIVDGTVMYEEYFPVEEFVSRFSITKEQ